MRAITLVQSTDRRAFDAPDASADVVVGLWSAFRAAPSTTCSEPPASSDPGGRLLVVHDYGRDDVAELRGRRSRVRRWTRRDGPFLAAGFKIRVLHCWWTFDSLDEARTSSRPRSARPGRAVAARLTRPRLSYNVAVYHRTLGEESA